MQSAEDKLQASGVVPVDIDLLHNITTLSVSLLQLFALSMLLAHTRERGPLPILFMQVSTQCDCHFYSIHTNIRVSNQQPVPHNSIK
jgi:hypothetical protein